MPKATEIATLIVQGKEYKDWESVSVKQSKYLVPPFFFRFTCSEESPPSKNLALMQILPGDDCKIMLAGIQAFSGIVSTRQVFYDGRRHYIEIQGSDYTIATTTTSTVTKTQEYRKVNIDQFIRAQLSPYSNLKFKVVGGKLPTDVFDRISLPHGMSTYDTIDLHLRALGNFPITSNANGDFIVVAGPSGDSDTVTEGKDILEGREIIYNQGMAESGKIPAVGQRPGNNEEHGPKIASGPFSEETFQSFGKGVGPMVVPMEVPGWTKQHVGYRARAERDWLHQDQIQVFITVQGWLKASGGLWDINQTVSVNSPMLVMDGSFPLMVRSITFVQDNNVGSRTILELMNQEFLNAQPALPQRGG